MDNKTKALVILSGGQDSTTCLYWALAKYDAVEAITFVYGQKHAVELECANAICMKEKIKHKVVYLDFMPDLVTSALTSNGNVNEMNEKGLPASFVPNRNAIFITLAHSYAQKIGAAALVTGVCQTDYSGYPDCRATFVDKLEETLNIGSASNIRIEFPLMYITKAQTFKMAADLGVLDKVLHLSHTCYNGDHEHLHPWGYGCGECPACELRAKGFDEYMKSTLL